MDKLRAQGLIEACKQKLNEQFNKLDQITLSCQERVLNAFRKNKIALRHFNATTGYGYDDIGRDTLKQVYADVFGAESANVSPNIVSGTHAIALALYANLTRGNNVLSVSGLPYDTIQPVIFGDKFSLKSEGVTFNCVPLVNNDFDYDKIADYMSKNAVDMIYIQRSRGYEERVSLSVYQIQKVCSFLRELDFKGCIFVDNCYGEFVEELEPTHVGADLVAGSLIKNIGGGIAPTGGYVVGKKEYIDNTEARLTCPSIAGEVGSYTGGYRLYYQGLFLAPHTVNQALKTSMLMGACLQELGYQTIPTAYQMPTDITRSVRFDDEKKLIDFIQSVQSASPIDSYLTTYPWEMPGYQDKVIMAAGCFVQGSSIELSADAPIKPPYIAYVQGGVTFEHGIIALKEILLNL